MFPVLLVATFLASMLVCAMTIALFTPPIARVLRGRLSEGATTLWTRSLLFAVCVIGVAVGARLWEIEAYADRGRPISTDRLSLEIYKTILATAAANVAVVLVVALGVGLVALMKRPQEA